jgi:predicted O-methyltransferase YrrM
VTNEIKPKDLFEGIKPSGAKRVPGWNSQNKIFDRLVNETRPSVIIEVGTWLGASAIHMATAARNAGVSCTIYCVDTWLGAEEFWTRFADTPERNLALKNGYPSVYYKFLSNVVEHGSQDTIVPIPNTSHIGSIILKHMRVQADLIYVDGSHEYEDVKSDIKDYMPLLRKGGVMFGDDMTWKSVREAVDHSLGKKVEVVDNNFWVFRKND